MRVSRLFLDTVLTQGQTVSIDGERLNYIANVLRLKTGATVSVFNGKGGEYDANIVSISKRSAELEIGDFSNKDIESSLSIVLAQGISRGERMDFTLQKATELAVSRIIPLFSERCTVNLKGERLDKRVRHWQGTVRSACEQSGRNLVPNIDKPIPLTEFLNRDTGPCKILLDPESTQSLASISSTPSAITILIGPEGGFSDNERRLAYAKNYQGVQLGPRILRTETAALAAISAIQTLWGDFK